VKNIVGRREMKRCRDVFFNMTVSDTINLLVHAHDVT
jgi:hypothetical protein